MAKALGLEPVGGVGYKPKKSNKGWWITLWLLLLLASLVAGFHFGGKELLKHQADRQAVERVALPVPTAEKPKVTTWELRISGSTIDHYRFLVFPNGLECLSINSRQTTCNWEKFNADPWLKADRETDS